MSGPRDEPRVWGIIPAAGMGRRMGMAKQIASVGHSTMVCAVARSMLDAGVDGLIVVTRAALLERLGLPSDDRIRIAVNDDPNSEMIDSIRVAAATLPELAETAAERRDLASPAQAKSTDADGIMVIPADMPAVTAETCRLCLVAFAREPDRIVIAVHAGRRGHPIIFPGALLGTAIEQQGGLRMLPQLFPDRILRVETPDRGATRDIDTWTDYRRMRAADA